MTPSLSPLTRGDRATDERGTDNPEPWKSVGPDPWELPDPERRESAEESQARGPPSFLGRLLYGAVLIFTGLNHFRNAESMSGYAEAKGVPMADLAVPFSGGMLVTSGLGIILWRLPKLAAGAAVTFFVAVTPMMHDFWNADEESKQQETNNFLKNVALLGAALAFLSRASED